MSSVGQVLLNLRQIFLVPSLDLLLLSLKRLSLRFLHLIHNLRPLFIFDLCLLTIALFVSIVSVDHGLSAIEAHLSHVDVVTMQLLYCFSEGKLFEEGKIAVILCGLHSSKYSL